MSNRSVLVLRLLVTFLLGILAQQSFAEVDRKVIVNFERALDTALNEPRPDYAERLELVSRVDAFLAKHPASYPRLALKNRLVEAKARMRLGEFEASRSIVGQLCPAMETGSFPELSFQCIILDATLRFIAGDVAASVQVFEDLYAQDLSDVSNKLLDRGRISYAAVLSENGQTVAAVDMYEQLVLSALTKSNDPLALRAGNNLIVILIKQGDYQAAEQALQKLQSALERQPNSVVASSLRLHTFELARFAGDSKSAIDGLRAFIVNGEDKTPLMVGAAYRMLAEALRDVGELDSAEDFAHRGIEILGAQAHEVAETRVSLAEILLLKQDYAAAERQLAELEPEQEAEPARRVRIHRARLQALLQRSEATDALSVLEALTRADAERDQLASNTRAEYFEARLLATRQGLELRQAEAQAEAARLSSANERRAQKLWLGLVIAAALGICLLMYSIVNRNAERRRLRAQEELNEELGLRIEQKTQELTANHTARQEMERALERSKRTEAIGKLAGNVAHDFNNLLQVIASGNELLDRDDVTPTERATLLDLSRGAVGHATRIIRQLLAYSRQQDLDAEPRRFSDYLAETRDLLCAAPGEHYRLEIEDRSGSARVEVDTAKLTTSLLNLLSNSADAMPEGGQLRLSAKALAISAAELETWSELQAGDYLQLSLEDTGVGMTATQVAQAHEPFYTTKDDQSGTGLGLSSVYGFVKQSGGDLRIHSLPGLGTQVRILLPLVEDADVTPQPFERTQTLSVVGRRLLLVEDNDTVAGMLQTLLENIGMSVVRVDSGEVAQSLLENDSAFDLVLTDVRMPGSVDGVALARWMSDAFPNIKVLLMSGFSELETNDTDLPLIRKPFTAAKLMHFISEHGALATT